MIPTNSLSSVTITSNLIGSKKKRFNIIEDYESGDIALNTVSNGLMFQEWKMWIENNSNILLKPDNQELPILIYSGADIDYITFTFDKNMNLIYLYRESGVWKFNWFDTSTNNKTITEYSNEYSDFQLIFDDKRSEVSNSDDVLLFYVKNKNLYYRQQRDRYTIEYLLKENITGRLCNVCMGANNRLHMKFDPYGNSWLLNFKIYINILSDDIIQNYNNYQFYVNNEYLNNFINQDIILKWYNTENSKYVNLNTITNEVELYTKLISSEPICNVKIYKNARLLSNTDFVLVSVSDSDNAEIMIKNYSGNFWKSINNNINLISIS